MSNLESLQTYAYEMQKSEEAKQLVIMIDKLWDHANLAQRQIAAFRKKDADIDNHLNEKLDSKMGSLERELSKELISLISLRARSFPIIQVLSLGVYGGCVS